MLKTLHSFLARELAKVTLLSLVAFTLVMTVFAIIEPFRKQGLATDQVIGLIGYTLPAMVSLTFPVAALFAATIVYGRFSQDNELLACRAGGISTIRLLEPALVLGLVVTAASLWLSNSVTPYLARRAGAAIQGNLRGIVLYKIAKQGYVKHRDFILHADSAEAGPDGVVLHGVVLARVKRTKDPNHPAFTDANLPSPYDITLMTADRTGATFQEADGESYVAVQAERPVVMRTSDYNIAYEESHPIDSLPIENPLKKDEPAWYSWDQLVETLRNPVRNAEVRQGLQDLCAELGYQMLLEEVVSTIRSGRPYTKLRSRAGEIELSAPRAEQDPNRRRGLEALLLADTDARGARRPVIVRVLGARDVRILEADSCRVEVNRSPMKNASLVSLELTGDVRSLTMDRADARLPGAGTPGPAAPLREPRASGPAGGAAPMPAGRPGPEWVQRERATIGDLEMPPDLAEAMSRLDPNHVLASVGGLTSDRAVLERARRVASLTIPRLRGAILAEMHGRMAYGLSCFLMVAMGAALGLLYRGGQLLSAFVITVIPASVVIILIIMGKQMLGNPKVTQWYGLAAVWGGIGLLMVGNLFLYAHLSRK